MPQEVRERCQHLSKRYLNARTSCMCSSVRLTLFNCCHSYWQSQSSGCTVYNLTHALFVITTYWSVSISCLQHLQEDFKIFKLCAFCDELLSQTFLHAVPYRPGSWLLHLADCSSLSRSQCMQRPLLPCVDVLFLLAP